MGDSHFPLIKMRIFLLAFFCYTTLTRVKCLNFTFQTFVEDDEEHFIRMHSEIEYKVILVTPDTSDSSKLVNQTGLFLRKDPMELWRTKGNRRIVASFNSTFVLNISPIPDKNNSIGEGLAFVLKGNQISPGNSHGQWLGMVNETTNNSTLANIVAMEFDTRKSFSEDIDGNHVGLDVNSVYSVKQVPLSDYGVNLSGGDNLTFRVQYDGNNISVFLLSLEDKTGASLNISTLVLTWPIDLSEYLPQKVFVGFSGSTSNYVESNHVLSWDFHSMSISEKKNLLPIWITLPVIIVSLSGIAYYLYWARVCCKQESVDDGYPLIEQQIRGSSIFPRKFELRELTKATNNFSLANKLGMGGSGTVYKGVFRDKAVAVKRVSKDSSQGKQEFIAEVTIIGSLSHKNLVKLIGWCYESNELLIVSELMPNGSLDKLLFGNETRGVEMEEVTRSWKRRHNILLGIAQALDYIHSGCEERVLHRDVKASNVLLDSEFNAKLGDFGLARIIQQRETHHTTRCIAGTPGYMAPEYFLTGRATPETDVYAFGVLVLEVVSGRRAKRPYDGFNNNMVIQIWGLYGKGMVLEAVDSRLIAELDEDGMRSTLVLGLACCHPNSHERPSMRSAMKILSGEAELPILEQEIPAFVWPASPLGFQGNSHTSTESSDFSQITEIYGR